VSAGRGFTRRLGFAALAAASLFGATGPSNVVGPASVKAATQAPRDATSAPAAGSVAVRNVQLPSRGAIVMGGNGHGPVWMGREKRGNRRNRSRFTYFR
jgi:PPE-repeat protein